MEKKIFPFQMVNPSVESLHARHSRTGSIIYWVILGVLILMAASLPFVEVEVNTRSRGMVRSDLENNSLLIPASGQIQFNYLENNREVKKGDTLLVLNSNALNEQIRFEEDRHQEVQALLKDFDQLVRLKGEEPPSLETTVGQQEFNQYWQKQAEFQLRIQHAKQVQERQALLLSSGSIAQVEYDQAAYELQLAQTGLDVLTDQYRRNWAQEKQRYSNELKEVQSQFQRLAENRKQYVLTAPIDGSITQFSGVQNGNFVSAGQVVAQISAHNDLLVEAYISPADVGLIRHGMDVQFQIDAFHSNQWGLITGKVVEISKDIVVHQDTPVFLVKCSMDQDHLSLPNGYQGNIKKGMTLTTHFAVAKRSLYDLLYDKMDDWLDPSMG